MKNDNIHINQSRNILFNISGLKASHITGIIIASYITVILLGLGYREQTISWIVASIGLTYPVISMIGGIISDRIGRFKVYVIGKIFCCIFIFLALFFTQSKILAVCLYMTEAIENGIEPLINATATDNSNEKTRLKIFTWLSLGGSIGMVVISLVSAYLFDFNMQIYLIVLILMDCISVYFMRKLTSNSLNIMTKDKPVSKKSDKEGENKDSFAKMIMQNKYLLVFSVCLIIFSILYSQLNYSFVIKLKNIYGKQIGNKFGLLLAIYYFVTIIFTLFYNKNTTKKSCVDNLIRAGVLYTICMSLITISNNIVILGISLALWAVAQIMVAINNSVFVSENCKSNNVGIMTVFFSIISSSGVVIGPIASGFIIKQLGLTVNWGVMTVLGCLGIVIMYLLKNKYIEKEEKE